MTQEEFQDESDSEHKGRKTENGAYDSDRVLQFVRMCSTLKKKHSGYKRVYNTPAPELTATPSEVTDPASEGTGALCAYSPVP